MMPSELDDGPASKQKAQTCAAGLINPCGDRCTRLVNLFFVRKFTLIFSNELMNIHVCEVTKAHNPFASASFIPLEMKQTQRSPFSSG